MLLVTLTVNNVFAANGEKEALKDVKADIVELKKSLPNADGNSLLQAFNHFKSLENQNSYEISNYDEALFRFQAQVSPALQELIIENFCTAGAQDSICLADSELTRDQLEFQIAAAITYALNGSGPVSDTELLAIINSLPSRIISKIIFISGRSIATDEEKDPQSTVGQSNDGAIQQGNIGVAVLQQLSGILTLIFR
jgi:hypothetical protein